MMKSIVEEKLVSFKTLEQKIFSYVCELGREITTIMLEAYDKELADGRDKKNYRDKGTRTTTIKTVYGIVQWSRFGSSGVYEVFCVYAGYHDGAPLVFGRERHLAGNSRGGTSGACPVRVPVPEIQEEIWILLKSRAWIFDVSLQLSNIFDV